MSDRPRMALLNASYDEATPRNFRRELDADLAEFDVTAGELPPDDGFDAGVITGSRASVYWDEPWIADLLDWVRRADERGLPLLGVCYGHQVLAAALGGRVAAMDGYEIGYREVEHDGGRLFEGIPERFLVFTTHGDEVVELPPGAESLAHNDYSLHAFRRGNAFGVQFHPEYDAGTAEHVTRGKEGDVDAGTLATALESITEANYRRACAAKRVFGNFGAYVRERTAAAAAD